MKNPLPTTQWQKTESLPAQNKEQCPLLPLPVNIIWDVLARASRQEKERKGIQNGKEYVKMSLLADDIILYIETLKDSNENC